MRTYTALSLSLSLSLAACGGKHADENNDTGFGDDGGTGAAEPEPEPDPPAAIEDHGAADFCLARAEAYADTHPYLEEAIENYKLYERWYSPAGRAYKGYLDLTDKPSPMTVPLACPIGWPLFGNYIDHTYGGGSPSCLNAGYHFQLPFVGYSDQAGPGDLEFPYSVDIVTNTIGNPPQSGRATWMAPGCCPYPPTEEELAGPDWAGVIGATGSSDFYRSSHADCSSYVRAIGVVSDAAGYPSDYEPTVRLAREMNYSRCVYWGSYEPYDVIEGAAFDVGDVVPYHPTRVSEQWPANLNYEWIASLGLITWADFEGFGSVLDTIVQKLIGYLYLPDTDFPHGRYGTGGGCHFPTAIRWSDSAGEVIARFTCPVGYYAEFPNFSAEDPDFYANGLTGTCTIDGVDYGGFGNVPAGQAISPIPNSDGRHFTVHDVAALGEQLELSAMEGVTSDLAVQLVDAYGDLTVQPGDRIAWWSSPWSDDPQPIDDALAKTIGYDVDDLMEATGWSHERATTWVDQQEMAPLGELIDGLPAKLASRPSSTLRKGNTFRVRVERGSEVMFLFFGPDGERVAQ